VPRHLRCHRTALGASRGERRWGIADDEMSRRAGIDVALRHTVYTSVQTLEIRCKSLIWSHFRGLSAGLAGGQTCSAIRCSITSSDMTRGRLGHPPTAWDGCTESLTSTSVDCTLSQLAHHGNRAARVGVGADAPLRSRLGLGLRMALDRHSLA
jgi:hypothetical protein